MLRRAFLGRFICLVSALSAPQHECVCAFSCGVVLSVFEWWLGGGHIVH